MPNSYATAAELKQAAPDAIRTAVTKYDALLTRLASGVSRWIDNECKRIFYPALATRRFGGSGGYEQRVPDLISITSVEVSWDRGVTYTTLTTDDYIATVEGDENSLKSYTVLTVNANSATLSYWPTGQRSIRIVGIWGYADDRDRIWDDTGDTVEDSPLTSSATTLTVNDVDGLDIYGVLARFQGGQILRIESEYVETSLTINTTTNTIGIVRGRNGTTAAQHAQNVAISVWRPPEPVHEAVVIQSVRQMLRGFQGFGDARANPDIGQLFFFKSIDPEAAAKLQAYRNLEIP